ncbi:hypothetical protein FNZ56_03185 [Pseudoluteimonas lycopersici]|uniref:DoxX family protein n=1 Tax=Pseudoluteimonas lycopersici TaxID=1324796 RepID=A0A516V341_9GAMM|nr:DUF6326 family protein [Lysobacter lycopersici]QDQ72948.1 hypothetical protein FNZ56_03185 [Lysobacter lycopersici]
MSAGSRFRAPLDTAPVNVRVKLALLWAATMFCYVYGDYFELYVPGKLQEMIGGQLAFGPATQGALVGTSLLLIVPALMVVFTVLLAPRACRLANIVLGVFYALVMAMAVQGAWYFYKLFGAVEIALTLSIAWQAWRWPRRAAEQRP